MLSSAGVKTDFRRFEELLFELNELKGNFDALGLSLTLQLGDTQTLETNSTTLADAINELLTQIKEKTNYGVYTGLTITAQDVPDMTVKVASGTIYFANGDRYVVAEAPALVIFPADAINPRKDVVFVNPTGLLGYLSGTAGAVPVVPQIPEGAMLLAEIAVAANATAIETADITDKAKQLFS